MARITPGKETQADARAKSGNRTGDCQVARLRRGTGRNRKSGSGFGHPTAGNEVSVAGSASALNNSMFRRPHLRLRRERKLSYSSSFMFQYGSWNTGQTHRSYPAVD